MSITILLADDHHIVRQGLRALLAAEPGLEVIGEAHNATSALQLVDRRRPDVVVLDLMMNGLHSLEVIRQIKQRHPGIYVIVLSMYDKEAYVVEALNNGASAYILKGSDSRELIQAIQMVTQGHQFYLSPPLSEQTIAAYIQKAQTDDIDPYDILTNREREVLHLVVNDMSNAEIAECLTISVRTVEVHRSNMMRKLGLNSRSDLFRYALRRGILPPDE